jgi:hypothetical protein
LVKSFRSTWRWFAAMRNLIGLHDDFQVFKCWAHSVWLSWIAWVVFIVLAMFLAFTCKINWIGTRSD